MTPEQAVLVEDSFLRLGPVTAEIGERFYDRLFDMDPSLRALFVHDAAGQPMRLIQVLAYVVSNLRAPDSLLSMVRDLGRKHAKFGVQDAYYDTFKQALLATLAERLKENWSQEVASAWDSTYDMIADEMRGAQHEATALE